MAPSHVLVPLDGSPLADKAFEQALELFDCRVTVLNVVTPIDATMSEGGILAPDEDRRESARERAEHVIERAQAQAADSDRTIETVVETGDPADSILDMAQQCGADMIVLGHRGLGRVKTILLGSVAQKVVQQAECSASIACACAGQHFKHTFLDLNVSLAKATLWIIQRLT